MSSNKERKAFDIKLKDRNTAVAATTKNHVSRPTRAARGTGQRKEREGMFLLCFPSSPPSF